MVYYLGYKLLWDKYPEMEFIDGDPRKVEVLDRSPENGFSMAGSPSHGTLGRAIKAEHVPTTLVWKSRHEMPDFEGPSGFICVSDHFKNIIEKFEPNVHQFFPLRVINKKGEQIAERWLWVVCNLIDSVDREHTNFNFIKGALWSARGVENPRLVFSKKQIAGKHFWRDKYLMGGGIYASDEAAQELKASELSALVIQSEETI